MLVKAGEGGLPSHPLVNFLPTDLRRGIGDRVRQSAALDSFRRGYIDREGGFQDVAIFPFITKAISESVSRWLYGESQQELPEVKEPSRRKPGFGLAQFTAGKDAEVAPSVIEATLETVRIVARALWHAKQISEYKEVPGEATEPKRKLRDGERQKLEDFCVKRIENVKGHFESYTDEKEKSNCKRAIISLELLRSVNKQFDDKGQKLTKQQEEALEKASLTYQRVILETKGGACTGEQIQQLKEAEGIIKKAFEATADGDPYSKAGSIVHGETVATCWGYFLNLSQLSDDNWEEFEKELIDVGE